MKENPSQDPLQPSKTEPLIVADGSESWEAQIEKLTQAIEECATFSEELYHRLATAYYLLKQYPECLASCDKIIELSQDAAHVADAYLWKGRVAMEEQEYQLAIEHYLACLEQTPANTTAIAELGQCYQEVNDWENTLNAYQKLHVMEGCKHWACSLLGQLFFQQSAFDLAHKYFEDALAEPGFWSTYCYHGLGRIYAEKQEYETAIGYFKQTLEISPKDADSHYCLGLTYQRLNDFYRAMHHYTQALETYAEFSEIYNNMAVLYQQEGDYRAAIQQMEKALAFSYDDNQKGFHYLNLIKLHKSLLEYDRVDYYKTELSNLLGVDILEESDDDDNEDNEEYPE
ncbi:MAG: tetratricopeptide repeat protein [Bacteroidota bacterium]